MARYGYYLHFHLGPSTVQTELLNGYSNANASVDMASAVIAAIRTVSNLPPETNHPRIALLTPYITPVHQKNIEFLQENGIDVVVDYNLGFKTDKETTSMSPESLFEHTKCLVSLNKDIDAVFIGCSAFRSTGNFFSNIYICILKYTGLHMSTRYFFFKFMISVCLLF